jgi:hypothetical protein
LLTGSKIQLSLFLFLGSLTLGFLGFTILSGTDVREFENIQIAAVTPTPTSVSVGSTQVELFASLVAPTGELTEPYVIVTAFGNQPGSLSIGIRGTINDANGFSCSKVPCKLPLSSDSIIRFHAYYDQGISSPDYTAIVRFTQPSIGVYLVTLESLLPEQEFVDSCYSIWGKPTGQLTSWSQMPRTPYQLNTNLTLHYLAARLLDKDIVDASSCPSGGMVNGTPDGCGIEVSRPAMIEWQNKYDSEIWMVGDSIGIPPILLKTLILQESQFWPANSRYFMEEFGLAQINDMGADAALRWDVGLFKEVCSGVLSNCSVMYYQLPESLRAMVRGALLNKINAQCLTCNYGLNMDVANASIYTIARVLHANCWESGYILDQYNGGSVDYVDLWKFTMVSYHSGYGCLDVAVQETKDAGESINWTNVSGRIKCQGAKQYVDNFWYSLTNFNNTVIIPSTDTTANFDMVPTRAAPTPSISNASLRVRVFVDNNNNKKPDPGEGVSGVPVMIAFMNGMNVSGTTDDQGEVVFSLSGRAVGENVKISLVNLYRTRNLTIPETGTVEVLFKFIQPEIPPSLP